MAYFHGNVVLILKRYGVLPIERTPNGHVCIRLISNEWIIFIKSDFLIN